MFEELLQTATANRRRLTHRIEELIEEIDREEIREKWIDYEPSEREDVRIGAEDGSYNLNQYQTCGLYAVGTKSFYHDGELQDFRSTDIDIFTPYTQSGDRLRVYMSILEKKAALHFLEQTESDIFLLDGSNILQR